MMGIQKFAPLTLALGGLVGCGTLALLAALLPSMIFYHGNTIAIARPRHMPMLPAENKKALEDYAAISERPLFNPNRRGDPLPAGDLAKGQLPPLTDYRLVGIVLMKSTKIGLIERQKAKQVVTVHPGDDLDGRRVDDIKNDGIHLSGGQDAELLAMPRMNGASRTGPESGKTRKDM